MMNEKRVMCDGKFVFKVRMDVIISKTEEEKNKWIFDHQEDDGKMIVMRNMFDEHHFLHVPVVSFEATMEPYILDGKEDEEDIF